MSIPSGHTEEIQYLMTGEYHKNSEATRNILEFVGKSVKQQEIIKTEDLKHRLRKRNDVSYLEFSDGVRRGPIKTDCALRITLVSGGDIYVEDDLFEFKIGPASFLERRKFKKHGLDEVVFKHVADMKPRTSEKDKRKEFAAEGYSEYTLKRAHTAMTGGMMIAGPSEEPSVGPYQRMSVMAILENKNNECLFELPMNETLVRNLSEKFSEDNSLKELKKDLSRENIMSCSSLIKNVLSESNVEVKNIYIDVQKGTTFYGKHPNRMTPMDTIIPLKCFVEIQSGSETKILESSPLLGVVLWSTKLDYPISVKEIKDVEKGPEQPKTTSYIH